MTGGARASRGDRRRFRHLSAFAWSVAAGLTGASGAGFLFTPDAANDDEENLNLLSWYRPTFTETRTCFNEVVYDGNRFLSGSRKWGKTLFYYAPTLALVAVNCVFLCRTGRKVFFLRRGSALLKRFQRDGGGGKTGGRGLQDKGSGDQTNGVRVYIKLVLAGDIFEFLAELVTWTACLYQPVSYSGIPDLERRETVWKVQDLLYADHTYVHRTVGFWADLFRALVVLLVLVVAPDLRAFWWRMRGKGGDSPARGAATRPAPRPAARPGPRTGQQESTA